MLSVMLVVRSEAQM